MAQIEIAETYKRKVRLRLAENNEIYVYDEDNPNYRIYISLSEAVAVIEELQKQRDDSQRDEMLKNWRWKRAEYTAGKEQKEAS